MGLSRDNVFKAQQILKEVAGMTAAFFDEWEREHPHRTGIILGAGRLSDGGWENIFINIENITKKQLALFNERKGEVHNSSFIEPPTEHGITRLGWF